MRIRTRTLSLVGSALLICAFTAGPSFSQAPAPNVQNPMGAKAAPGSMPSMQAQLLSKIHQINQLEIKAGRLAQKNSSNFKVRAFGRRLVIDHSAADRKVLHFARANHIVLMTPQPQNAQQQQQMQNTMATMQRLQTLKGNAFDMQFLQFMQKGHDNAIQMLAQKEKMLPPSGLKSMIKDMIPILTQHYEIAVNLKIRDTAGGMAGGY